MPRARCEQRKARKSAGVYSRNSSHTCMRGQAGHKQCCKQPWHLSSGTAGSKSMEGGTHLHALLQGLHLHREKAGQGPAAQPAAGRRLSAHFSPSFAATACPLGYMTDKQCGRRQRCTGAYTRSELGQLVAACCMACSSSCRSSSAAASSLAAGTGPSSVHLRGAGHAMSALFMESM